MCKLFVIAREKKAENDEVFVFFLFLEHVYKRSSFIVRKRCLANLNCVLSVFNNLFCCTQNISSILTVKKNLKKNIFTRDEMNNKQQLFTKINNQRTVESCGCSL